jgi:hypothetical protein
MSETTPQLLNALYQRLHGRPPDAALAERLEEIAYEDGLHERAPDWLTELLSALAEDRPFADRTLDGDAFFSRDYDITDFFASLAPALGLDRVHYGEYMVLSSEPIGASVCFDFESLTGGVDLRLMRWPSGPWPHWERWPPGDPRNRVDGA